MAFSESELAQLDRVAERRERSAEFLRHHPEYLTPAPLERMEPARRDVEVTAAQAAAMDDVLEALA
jgi:hypothetical protein